MGEPEQVIRVEGLRKHYGSVRAVDGISFSVGRGEIFGMLGPNGAGKTTTIECMEGLRTPDSGTLEILGLTHKGASAAIKSRIGVQLQTTGMYPKLTVAELIDLFGSFFPRAVPTTDLIRMVGLEEKSRAFSKDLSGGQRQRLSVAMALVNGPEIVFLDEPTTGMDPQARRALWDVIRGLRDRGKTVVLTTHYMEEAEHLCDRVAIVDRGHIIEMDSPSALVNKHFKHIAIEFDAPEGTQTEALAALPGVANLIRGNGKVTLYSSDVPGTMAGLLGLTGENAVSLKHMVVRQASLEDVFLKITGRSMRE
ncbi:MAG: ABC transporter ATP-binding protein [Firmicutes bacterium]|nr:ABC transporter ATP-binding protein [Bacillota bacterium]